MRILGIESSCDETSIAIVNETDGSFKIENHILASQVEIHNKYGGVVPEIAAREHVVNMFPMLEQMNVPRDGQGIDVIAVTSGPGLAPALRIGVELGKALAWLWSKPLVGVNHLEGHIYSVWLTNNEKKKTPEFPALCLLVSGGHTELILMKDHGSYELIGMTRDDAAGEAFDKVAKMLGLKYPGGPEISRLAVRGNKTAIKFPRPMSSCDDYDFSFSGLKTAVMNQIKNNTMDSKEDIAASFQQAVIDSLVNKTLSAMERYNPKSIILTGGVSANTELRTTLESKVKTLSQDISFHSPSLDLTGDNAVMIAVAGGFCAKKKEFADPLTLVADPNMRLA